MSAKNTLFSFGILLVMASYGWAQEAFVYMDRIVVEQRFTQATQIAFPAGAMNVETQPRVSVVYETVTNTYPEEVAPLVQEHTSLTNTLRQRHQRIRGLEREAAGQEARRKLYHDLMIQLAQNQGARSGELLDKYERQLTTAEERVRALQIEVESLRQDIAPLEARSREIAQFLARQVIPLKVWHLARPASGMLRYSVSGGWKMRYTLSTDRETLGAEVEIATGVGIEARLSSLWIIGFPYVSQQMEERLPRWRLRLHRAHVPRAPMVRSAGVPEAAVAIEDAQAFAAPPVETVQAQGTVWHITNRVVLRRQTTIPLWEPRRIAAEAKYFVLAPRSSWGWHAITISNTLPHTLIPGEIVLDVQGKTHPFMLAQTVVPQATHTFPGLEVRDIEVRRDMLRDYRDMPSLLRPTVLHEQSWRTTVRNRMNRTIRLTVWDRIPISAEERIVVRNVAISDKSPAEIRSIQTNDGLVQWEISLRPGEERVFHIGYTVEYPRGFQYYGQEE